MDLKFWQELTSFTYNCLSPLYYSVLLYYFTVDINSVSIVPCIFIKTILYFFLSIVRICLKRVELYFFSIFSSTYSYFTYLLFIPIYSRGTLFRHSWRIISKRFSLVRSPQQNSTPPRPAPDVQRANTWSYAPTASLNLHKTDQFSTETFRNTFTVPAPKTRSDGTVVGHRESRRP